MKTTIYLIRHGEYDKEDNTHLTDNGIEQANKLALLLKEEGISHIISSPIERAKKTALPLSKLLDCDIEEDAAFTEFFSDKESFDEALERIRIGISDVVERYEGESIAIFSHGFTVGEFLLFIQYGTSEELPIGSVDSGAYAKIVHANGHYQVVDTYRIKKS